MSYIVKEQCMRHQAFGILFLFSLQSWQIHRYIVRGKRKEKSALMSIPDLQTCAQVFELKHDPFIRLVTVEVSPRKKHISYVSCILQQWPWNLTDVTACNATYKGF